MLRHVNITPHLLLLACPPLVRLVTTDHGPNTSTPVYVKGGAGLTRSTRRSAILWVLTFHEEIKRLAPIIQEPADRIMLFIKKRLGVSLVHDSVVLVR